MLLIKLLLLYLLNGFLFLMTSIYWTESTRWLCCRFSKNDRNYWISF